MTVATTSAPFVLRLPSSSSSPLCESARTLESSLPAATATPTATTTTIVTMPRALLDTNNGNNNNSSNTSLPDHHHHHAIKTLEDCEQTQTTSPTTCFEDSEEDEDLFSSHRSESLRSLVMPPCTADLLEQDHTSVPALEEEDDDAARTATANASSSSSPAASSPILLPQDLHNHATLKPTGRTPPVIKPYRLEHVPVRQRWMSLKVPPNAQIQAAQLTRSSGTNNHANSTSLSHAHNETTTDRRRVSFVAVHIREYDATLGDNPSCGYGPPISLDWTYVPCEPILLDDYEANRGRRRTLRQMMLNYYQRTAVLTYACGFTDQELQAAQKAMERIKAQRAMTKATLGISKIQEVWQSTKRKTQRLAASNKKKTNKNTAATDE